MNRKLQFNSRVRIFSVEEGGPSQGFFGFPDSGVRYVSVEVDGIPGRNTVGFLYIPGAHIHAGDEFEVDAHVLLEETLTPVLQPGVSFRIWDGRCIADGVVLKVYPAR